VINNITVGEYLGIPFAKPPIRELRFKPPVEVDELAEDKVAINPAKTCPQPILRTGIYAFDYWNPPSNIDEDCLQLNMWVPNVDVHDGKPVMVNLCGSSYYRFGASNDVFNGSVLAAYSGAIVVNLNFRLGALGFARIKDNENVKGNMGLLDQQIGLKWIQKNIKKYGGDPTKVTLIGDQSGSSSAAAHLYSDKSKNLFKRIAITSGVLENPWASRTNKYTEMMTQKLAILLECAKDKDGNLIKLHREDKFEENVIEKKNINVNLKCMQEKSYDDILNKTAIIKSQEGKTFGQPFSLIEFDGTFFTKNITSNKSPHSNKNVLMGNAGNEGSFYLWYYYRNEANCRVNFSTQPMTGECTVNGTNFDKIATSVKEVFGKEDEWRNNILKNYPLSSSNGSKVASKFMSSLLFDCGLEQFADKLSKLSGTQKIYVYQLQHRSVERNITWPKSFGTVHASLVEFLFGRPFRYPDHYDKDKLGDEQDFSRKIMKMHGRFAKRGKPTKDWNSYKTGTNNILILNSKFDYKKYTNEYLKNRLDCNCDWLIKEFEQEKTQD
uniref:Acetylcholinesterase n=1 Tax=Parastrongyloides trichosuri TaxID=131310 RepID=A0A0N4ZHC8_PARTI